MFYSRGYCTETHVTILNAANTTLAVTFYCTETCVTTLTLCKRSSCSALCSSNLSISSLVTINQGTVVPTLLVGLQCDFAIVFKSSHGSWYTLGDDLYEKRCLAIEF